MFDKNMLRAANCALRTASLFYERWGLYPLELQAKNLPLFSLYSADIVLPDHSEPLISCRDTFIEEGDPTGYKWATKYLDSWNHWQRLMEADWFREAFEKWQTELLLKLQQEALKKIKEISRKDGPTAFQAAKYLANQEWLKSTGKRGRPLKQKDSTKVPEDEDEADFKRATIRLATKDGIALNGS